MKEQLGDMTGLIAKWATELRSELGQIRRRELSIPERWRTVLEVIRAISRKSFDSPTSPIPQSTFCIPFAFDALLSLNLLSQIPLAWQDQIALQLKTMFTNDWITEHEEEWLLAYLDGSELLIQQHLRDLAGAKSAHILLITDLEYISSPGDQRPGNKVREHVAALGRIELNEQTIKSHFPEYQLTHYHKWTWEIEPRHRSTVNSVNHLVGAFELARRS